MCVEMPDVQGDTNRKAPKLPPCRICGERASGFHYGVNSCGACKGFFLRSLARISPYTCSANGHCKIGIETKRRKCCQKCRFDKCLQLGMSKDAIKIGRYTYSKRTQDTLELRQLKSDTPSVTLAVTDGLASESIRQLLQKGSDMDQDFPPADSNAVFSSNQTFLNGKTENSPEAGTSSPEGERAFCSAFSETTLSPDQMSVYSNNMARPDLTPLSTVSSALTPEGDADVSHSISSLDNHDSVSPGSSFASSCFSGNNSHNQHYARMATPEDISSKGSGNDLCEALSSPTFFDERQTIPGNLNLSADLTELVTTCQSQIAHHTNTGEIASIFTHFSENMETSQINKVGQQQSIDSGIPLQTHHNVVDFIKDSDTKTSQGSPSHSQKDELLPLSKILSDSISGHVESLPFSMKLPASNEMDTSEGQTEALDNPCPLQQFIQLIDSKGGDNFQTVFPPCVSPREKEIDNNSLPLTPSSSSPSVPSSSGEFQESVTSDHTGFSFVELLMSKKRPKPNIPLSKVLQASQFKDIQNPSSLMAALCGRKEHNFHELARLTSSGAGDLFKGTPTTSHQVSSNAFGIESSLKPHGDSGKMESDPTLRNSSPQDDTKPQTWDSEFSSSELERWISHLVDYHVANVFDNNTNEEMLLEKHTITSDKFRLEENTFGELRALDWKLYFEVYQSTGLDVDSRIDPLSTFLQGFHNESITAIKFIKKIPGFKQLPLSDQAKLIRGCAHEFQLMSVFKGWDNVSRQVTFLPLGLTLTEQDMKTLKEFQDLTRKCGCLDVCCLFTQNPFGVLQKLFNESAFENHIKMASSLQTLGLSLEQIIILKAIVAMAPDREELEAKNTVRQIYWKLINCLLYLLWKQSDEPGRKFAQITSALTELRSYSLLIRQAYADVKTDIELLTKHISIPYIFDLFF